MAEGEEGTMKLAMRELEVVSSEKCVVTTDGG